MEKRGGCAQKSCRAELEEVPPNAVAGNVAVEMPPALAQVGTVNVPTYGIRAKSLTNVLRSKAKVERQFRTVRGKCVAAFVWTKFD